MLLSHISYEEDEKKIADHELTMTYPRYSIKITHSNLRILLTDFFNNHIFNTLLKLLTLTSECCCQATFPTKKTKKKLADHEVILVTLSKLLTLASECC